MNVLDVANLTKKFGDFTAVDDISFSLEEGEILGFLGPNGAGKTTTIQMLLGTLRSTDGSILYFGKNLRDHQEEIHEQINFSSTYINLPWDLSVEENLTFISYLYKISDRKARVKKIVEIFDLNEFLKIQTYKLSAGQITRVNLAKAFINFPKILLLDEPTASLDPEIADFTRKFLLEERKKFQVSIILTSHNMREVEEVCDRVIFIDHGKIIANNTPTNLAKTIKTSHIDLLVKDGLKRLEQYCLQENIKYTVNNRYIRVDSDEEKIGKFLTDIATVGVSFDEISIEKPTLEDYFLENVRS